MKKKEYAVFAMAACLIASVSCGSGGQENENVVYYVNSDGTKLVPQEIELDTEGDERIGELLCALSTQPNDASMRQTIPDNVKVLGISTSAYQITVDFSEEYYQMGQIDEILTRAAIAKTLFQVEGYPYVAFTVESEPLVNKEGIMVGSMNTDTFVENPGGQINASQQTTLNLYFAGMDGTSLVQETRVVHYSSKISLENQEISEQVVLFSIVDSLTELDNVGKVQISINGDTSGKCRFTYDLATMYEADYGIVQEVEEPGTESTE